MREKKDTTLLRLINFQLIDLYLLLILFIAPILLLLANKEWFFTAPGYLDPFVYLGYFLHWAEHLPFWENYYKISRLPWILSGYIAYKIFSPPFAHYVLHLFYIYSNLFLLYFTLKFLLNRRSAFIASATLCFYIYFHGSGGWDYHNTACSSYYLLTFLLITYAPALRNSSFLIILGGSFFSLAVNTNTLMVNLFPIILLHWLLLSKSKKIQPIVSFIFLFCVGGIGSTILLGLTNYLTGGNFLFFMPQYFFSLFAVGHNYTEVWKLVVHQSNWLVFPGFILSGSVLALVFFFGISPFINSTKSDIRNPPFYLLSYYLILACITCFWQVMGVPLLCPDYMLFFAIVPHMFFALGSIIYLSNNKPASGVLGLKVISIITIVIFAFPLIFYGQEILQTRWSIANLLHIKTWFLFIPFSTGILGILCIMNTRISNYFIIPALLLLSISNVLCLSNPEQYSFFYKFRFKQDAYKSIIECDKIATEADSTLTIHWWFDNNETIDIGGMQISSSFIFHSFVATRGWLGNLLTGWNPNPSPLRTPDVMITKEDLNHLGESKKIGILSKNDYYLDIMQKKINNYGLDSKIIKNTKVSKGAISFFK